MEQISEKKKQKIETSIKSAYERRDFYTFKNINSYVLRQVNEFSDAVDGEIKSKLELMVQSGELTRFMEVFRNNASSTAPNMKAPEEIYVKTSALDKYL